MFLFKSSSKTLRGQSMINVKFLDKLQHSIVRTARIHLADYDMPRKKRETSHGSKNTISTKVLEEIDSRSVEQRSSIEDSQMSALELKPVADTDNGPNGVLCSPLQSDVDEEQKKGSVAMRQNPIKSKFFQGLPSFQLGFEREDQKQRTKSNEQEVPTKEVAVKLSTTKPKLNIKNLKRGAKPEEELKPNVTPAKGKLRAVVDIEMMKRELKQLEDPPLTPLEKERCVGKLQFEFFNSPCETLAQNLLGKILVRQLENGTILRGRIVETESYLGIEDKASHTYQNKMTPRNAPMYMPPGTIYVYLTYGMYHCFNISSQDHGSAVLLRACEPIEGLEHMSELRNSKTNSKAPKKIARTFKTHELCNGPSKLCIAFSLEKSHSKFSVCSWRGLWIENDSKEETIKIVQCSRIGIDSAGPEWANKPLRYYVQGNKSVSKRDKKAETALEKVP